MKSTLGKGGGPVHKNQSPSKKIQGKTAKEKTVWVNRRTPSGFLSFYRRCQRWATCCFGFWFVMPPFSLFSSFFCFFLCFFVCCYKTRKSGPYFASRPGIEVNPLCIHSGRLALPAVLLKVHHRPETLYVPKEVNTPHVDGLARISGRTQASYKSHPQPPESGINNIGWRGLLCTNPHKRWFQKLIKWIRTRGSGFSYFGVRTAKKE